MSNLFSLEPKNVFKYFEEICNIPHGSSNCKKISEYCEEFANLHNLFCKKDFLGNIIIVKNATLGYENSAIIIIQGHLDMVCEKSAESNINFLKDPLELKIDGDFLYANGTTLGADDGIAVAFALAILADKNISHPKLEVIFTVDEEIGMLGAQKLETSCLNGKFLINIDSESEGVFTVSCAGGATVNGIVPISTQNNIKSTYLITIDGLIGGHSGIEIDKKRANSNVLAGRLLYDLILKTDLNLISINGGLKDNAIPRKTTIKVCNSNSDLLYKEFLKISNLIKNEYSTTETNLEIKLEKCEDISEICLDKNSTKKIAFLLLNLPNGIQEMNADIEGLVQTSLNFGKLNLESNSVLFSYSLRSMYFSQKDWLINKIKSMFEFCGGHIEIFGEYPAWIYDKNSKLRKIFIETYSTMFNKEARIEAIHAGLECGILCEKIKGLDCISFGPNIYNIHRVSEKLSISSVERTWKFLLKILSSKQL